MKLAVGFEKLDQIAGIGGMISESTAVMTLAPWLAMSAGFAIVLVVGGFTLMGDGLRDALDPRGGFMLDRRQPPR
jgi:ABC-type dipeptide/oligopeptide/nickel transport system permease subunit